MLRSIKQLYGDKLGASDGEIGYVKDCYFDDQNWVVRYLIADSGDWLPGRLVLIAPIALEDFVEDGDQLLVHLTRKQIEDSPAIATHQPVSRQNEDDYYSYYQWQPYWKGYGHADAVGRSGDPHLRSAQSVKGYAVHTSEGAIGHVTDFIIQDKTWEICHLVVRTGSWFFGKEIAIGPKHVTRISYEESGVYVDVSSEAMRGAPEYDVPAWGYQDAAPASRKAR